MISTVIFDMDGVIINSEPIHFEIETSILQELGVSISKKEYQSYVGTTSREMWANIIDQYKLQITPDDAIRMSKDKYHYVLYHSEHPQLIKSTVSLIQGLKQMNKKLVLASSSTVENIEIILQKHQIGHYFDHVVGGDQVSKGKPDPEIFILAAKLAKTLPSQCLVIEDSRNGVLAAKAAGMKCIGYKNPDSGDQILYDADIVINTMDSLNSDNIFDLIMTAK